VNAIDFDAINARLNPEFLVPQWLPDGKRRGKEWVCANPMRADRHAGSFSVNLETGVWKDFAGGSDDWGKDLISLYAYLYHNKNQAVAARELANEHGIKLDPAAREQAISERAEKVAKIDAARPKLIVPVPADATKPTFKHWQYGMPTATWAYRDAQGRIMLYACRYDPPDERKQVLPYAWAFDPKKDRHQWMHRGFTGKDKRPLYGLDRLAANPDAQVLLVEGEGKADATQELMGDGWVAVGWMGGVDTAAGGHVDVSPLDGRRVIAWPDFDAQRVKLTPDEAKAGVDPNSKPLLPLHEQPGMRAMLAHAKALKGVASEFILVGYTIDPANGGWDLKDAKAEGWDRDRVLAYMKANAGDPVLISQGKRPAAAESEKPTPANDNEPPVPLDCSVNALGYEHLSEKNQPLNTWENLRYMLGQYGIKVRYNQVRKNVEVALPGRSYTADNRANCSLAELASLCARNRMPQSNLQEYVKLIADQNAYSPVADWIDSKPWDGTSRLEALYATVTADMDEQLKRQLMYRWLLSAVAAVFMPYGFEAHGALVFTGKQGIGKTRWIKRLAPPDLNVVLTGAVIDPADKDTVARAIGHWIIELGELDATFRKADIARLKAFVTLDVDKLRRPYDRIESEYQRRSVIGASVNDSQYLVDDTGNRRWWTIPATNIDYMHSIDMQQVWAELKTHYERGEQWHLTLEEDDALGKLNENHEATDPIKERIVTAFDWENPGIGQDMTATDVLIAVGFDKPSRKQATEASNVLRKLTGKEPHRKNSGRYFSMPRRKGGKALVGLDDQDTRPF
jgi:putative DNA primase/helicase